MSGRFQFRLQRLLDLRKQREQEAARRAASALHEVSSARLLVQQMDCERAAGAAELARTVKGGRTAGELQRMHLLLGHMEQHRASADDALSSAEQAAEQTAGEHTAALRMRQVLDRLRDRQRELWRVNAQQAEQKASDELAVLRHNGHGSRPAEA